MPASEAKMRYIDGYNRENYEKITLQVKKGVRDVWRGYADKRGLSMVAFVTAAVEKYISTDLQDIDKYKDT